ncbi:hypothetical protein EV13_0366 [Prochlorococcus sp. MIT 0702]|nr:hypothetical protein EV12_0108 [Prochlorococcus sp. MIT 0701]KGG30346.1 hypothetical protein EV13_0366 [Prochlorococcus sp. MIT 0702]KGG35764.1 hypothetical protein EV14_0772 [Prochlorococcus sp. MIT 0703]
MAPFIADGELREGERDSAQHHHSCISLEEIEELMPIALAVAGIGFNPFPLRSIERSNAFSIKL